jgi:hypothetical protein
MTDITDLITAFVAVAKDPKAWDKRVEEMNEAAGNLREARKLKAEIEAAQKAAAADLETARNERGQADRAYRDTAAQSNANAVRAAELDKRERALVANEQAAKAAADNLKANQDAREADLSAREKLAAKKLNDASKLMASYDEAKHKAALKLAS